MAAIHGRLRKPQHAKTDPSASVLNFVRTTMVKMIAGYGDLMVHENLHELLSGRQRCQKSHSQTASC